MNGGGQDYLGGNGILSQEESLDVIVQQALSFLAGKNEDYHLNPFVQLCLKRLDPSFGTCSWAHLHHVRRRFGIAALVQALFHGARELSSDLRVSVTVEDAPGLEGRLGEHLALDLAVQITSVRLDVDRCRSAGCTCSHLELASSVLEATQRLWHIVDLHVPQLLLLDALDVCLEVCHQVLDLFDLGIGVRVHDHSEVLHQAEVSAHGVSQARQLTELWDESDLIPSASVLVDEQWLVHVADGFVVASAVVLLVRCGSPVLVERCRWTLREVDPIDTIGLLVVARDHSRTRNSFLNGGLSVTSPPLSLVTQVVHPGQTVVCPDDLEADVDVEKDA